tara:strand:+ start:537 stop:1022 length:486 start_codon:yes stop_codon:yes gene_type:complete
MDKNTAMTISIGVLGGIDVFITATILPVPVWITFTAWASFFACGGGTKGLIQSILCNWTGIVIASLSLLAIQLIDTSPLFAAISVGIGSGVMVQASRMNFTKGFTPAIVWGFSQTVGSTAAGFPLLTGDLTNQATCIAGVAMLVGAIFGYVSEIVGGALET